MWSSLTVCVCVCKYYSKISRHHLTSLKRPHTLHLCLCVCVCTRVCVYEMDSSLAGLLIAHAVLFHGSAFAFAFLLHRPHTLLDTPAALHGTVRPAGPWAYFASCWEKPSVQNSVVNVMCH